MRPTMLPSFRIRRARDEAIRNRRWAMRLNSTELWRRAMDSAHGHFVTRVTSGTPAELSSAAAAINVTSDDTDPGPGAATDDADAIPRCGARRRPTEKARGGQARGGGRPKKRDAGKRRKIAESLSPGRKSGADMARLSRPCRSRRRSAPGLE